MGIPIKITSVMRGPKNKKATALGIVITPTNLIARINWTRTSSRSPATAKRDKCGKIAVIIEIVTIE